MTKPGAHVPSNETAWEFVIYKTEASDAGQRAERVLKRLCDHYLKDRSTISVVDITKEMDRVPPDVLVLPTVVRVSPQPKRRIIGDLSDREAAIRGLELETDA